MKEKTIEGILDIAMISCPNNCKEGICIVYENTVDEGTVLCPVCGGSGRIDYTNEMKAKAIKELIKAGLPSVEEIEQISIDVCIKKNTNLAQAIHKRIEKGVNNK